MNQLVSKLRRAELITHLVQVDRDTASEQDAAACVLDVLNAQVFRIAPYLYGVDLSNMEEEDDQIRVASLTEALTAQLGPDSVGMTTLILDPEHADAVRPEIEEDTLLLMRAVATAADRITTGDESKVRAMLSAEFAVRAAELTAKGLAELSISAPTGRESLTPAIEATTEALGALEVRLDHLEQRISEITQARQQEMRDWADSALIEPLQNVETRLDAMCSAQSDTIDAWAGKIDARLEVLEKEQMPAEWFLGQILSRIGDLDEQQAGNGKANLNTTLEWARQLDERLSAVADQLIPPEWFLGRIMGRIGELDKHLHGSGESARTAATDWANRLDDRLIAMSDQLAPPEWLISKILDRIDESESRLAVSISALEAAPQDDQMTDQLASLNTVLERIERSISKATVNEAAQHAVLTEQAAIKKSISSLKSQITTLTKHHNQMASDNKNSTDLIRVALAEIISR